MPMRWDQGYLPRPEWYKFARTVKQRDNYTCQHCGARHGDVVLQHKDHPGKWIKPESESESTALLADGWKAVLVQVGAAHLDQNPANNDPANVVTLCRGCHLRHDAPYHAIKARHTRCNNKRVRLLKTGNVELALFDETDEF